MRIVLLPGLDGTGTLFDPFVAATPSGFSPSVIAYPPAEPTGYRDLEPYVLDRLPPTEPYILLGESFSGPLALRIAARRPANLVGVVLVASFARGPQPFGPYGVPRALLRLLPVRSRLARTLLLGARPDAELEGLLERALGAVPAGVLGSRVGEVLETDELEALRKVAVPILYVQASRDRLVRRSSATQVLRAHPATEVVRVSGPHLVLQANPRACWEAVSRLAEHVIRGLDAV